MNRLKLITLSFNDHQSRFAHAIRGGLFDPRRLWQQSQTSKSCPAHDPRGTEMQRLRRCKGVT